MPLLKQAFVLSGVLLAMVEVGIFLGFTTYLLPSLQDPRSNIKADLETSSWIAASLSVTSVAGLISSSYYMDRFGRKPAFILNVIPGALGLLLMYFATNIYYLIAARALQGITVGSIIILGAIIIGEYADPVYRGMFLNLKTAGVYLGSTVSHMLGNYLHWRTVALVSLLPYFVIFGVVWMWPESPSWLATTGDFERSESSFYWLRGKSERSAKELEVLLKTQQKQKKSEQLGILKSIIIFCQKFSKKNFILPVQIYVFAATLLEMSGRHIFPAYGAQIISEICRSQNYISYTLCLDMLITVSTIFSSFLIRIFKRRTLLFVTGAFAVFVIMTACGYLFLVSLSVVPDVIWIPMALFGLFLALVNSACVPISFALIGEIFPLDHRAAGTTIAGFLIALNSFITLKTFPILLTTVHVYGTFFILGVIMTISLVFLYFKLPETKDRTLQEIEDYFNHGSFKAKDKIQETEEVHLKLISQ